MASNISPCFCVLFLVILLVATKRISGDPDPLQDFCVADAKSSVFMNGLPCLNPNEASPNHFMTSALRTPGNTSANPMGASIVAANTQNMPGLNTLGILMARIDMAVEGVVPPHIHPRASEILYLMEGKLSVGFVDSNTNKLFSHTLEAGDVFVFPRGTLHFAQNIGEKPAITINALNSQNPGILNVPSATFASSPAMPQEVLAKSFAISSQEVEQIRKLLGGT